jgi:hypothetical protein
MAFKQKDYTYFTYKKPRSINRKLGGIDEFIFDHKLISTITTVVIFAIGFYLFKYAFFFPIFLAIILLVKMGIPQNYLVAKNAERRVLDRVDQRKYFAEHNNLQYETEVALESDITLTDSDAIAKNYVSGEINGFAFWNADTRYEYTQDTEDVIFEATSATAIFLTNDVPAIQIISKDQLYEIDIAELRAYRKDNLQITQQFDKKYKTIVPKGHEHDALYILTPELLELILYYKPTFIEMSKQRVVIHNSFAIETKDDYKYLAEMIQELGAEFIDNTNRFKETKHSKKK